MNLDPLVQEIMDKVREKTERADHLRLTPDQYNAVCDGLTEWIREGGDKIRKMLRHD